MSSVIHEEHLNEWEARHITNGWKKEECGCCIGGIVKGGGSSFIMYGGTPEECTHCMLGIVWRSPKNRLALYPGGPFVGYDPLPSTEQKEENTDMFKTKKSPTTPYKFQNGRINPDVLDQDKYWRDKTGRLHEVRNMSRYHAMGALGKLFQAFGAKVTSKAIYRALERQARA